MSSPYGGPSWPQEPQPPSSGAPYGQPPSSGAPYGQPPSSGAPYGQQPDPQYGPPGGAPQGPPDATQYMPPGGSPYGPQYGAAPGAPYGPPGGGFPYGAPPPPPKSRTGLIVGLVIGAVVLLLCIGGGVLTAVAVSQSNTDPSSSPTVARSGGPTTDSNDSPSNGRVHKAFTDSCAPVNGALSSQGLAIESPSGRDSDIGPTALYFCSGSVAKGSARSGYLGVTAVLYDDFAGRTATERGMRGYESDRKGDESVSGSTVTDVSGVGEKAYMVTRSSSGQVSSVKIQAVDGNLTVYAQFSLSDMTPEDATKAATEIVKAYIAAS